MQKIKTSLSHLVLNFTRWKQSLIKGWIINSCHKEQKIYIKVLEEISDLNGTNLQAFMIDVSLKLSCEKVVLVEKSHLSGLKAVKLHGAK